MVENQEFTVGNRTYYGPHKWIIAVLGSDNYSVTNFKMQNKESLKGHKNLNISVLSYSPYPNASHNVKDYLELTKMTHQGIFLNIVDRRSGAALSELFYSQMNVYPSKKLPIIREYFQNS